MTWTQIFCTAVLVALVYATIAMAFMSSDNDTLEDVGEVMLKILEVLIILAIVILLLLGAIGVLE